jgi:hypothetical protein
MCKKKTSRGLRSVNVKMTSDMILELDRISGKESRSSMVRTILAAIIEAYEYGRDDAFLAAVKAGQQSASRVQKKIRGSKPIWDKVIIWVPELMHEEISRNIEGTNIRPADFIRGAVMGFTGINPMKGRLDGIDVEACLAQNETMN